MKPKRISLSHSEKMVVCLSYCNGYILASFLGSSDKILLIKILKIY